MAINDPYARLRSGVLGRFSSVKRAAPKRLRPGSLRLEDSSSHIEFFPDARCLDEHQRPHDTPAVFGQTEVGEVLMVEITSRGSRWGRLDVAQYTGRGLIIDCCPEEIEGDLVQGVRFSYLGLRDWLPDEIYQDDVLLEDGKYVGWTAELRHKPGTSVPLDAGYSLRISTGYEVGGEFDQRKLSTPLTITVVSDVRRPISEHIIRLDAVQGLLNIAHKNVVNAFSGSVQLQDGSDWYDFWESELMKPSAGSSKTQSFPYFGLAEIGGVTTVAEWVKLALTHHRSLVALVRPLLQPMAAESRMLTTATAMENWVAVHRRTDKWAAKVKDEPLIAPLTRRVSESWDPWIGDSTAWADRFWDAYNAIKHDPLAEPDRRELDWLELTGRWLLAGAVLDQATGDNTASSHLFGGSTSLSGVGHRAREWFYDHPRK